MKSLAFYFDCHFGKIIYFRDTNMVMMLRLLKSILLTFIICNHYGLTITTIWRVETVDQVT